LFSAILFSMKKTALRVGLFFVLIAVFFQPFIQAEAYYTNMDASVVVAVDKTGHTQNSDEGRTYINGSTTGVVSDMPPAVLNITGVGNPLLNIYNLAGAKSNYNIYITSPTFFGIAWTGAEVKLRLTRNNCNQDCSREYMTSGNDESRFGINVPPGDLVNGASYQAVISSSLDIKYSELPAFMIKIGG
jgi:hypothetical protein